MRGITPVPGTETTGVAMDSSDHYRKAEELAAKAEKYLGQGDGQESTAVWAAVAQVHATLALAAATGAGSGSQAAAKSSQANATEPLLPDPRADFLRKGGVPGLDG
jgi:hypothetical protein